MSALGGSTVAASSAATLIGAVAVFLAGSSRPLRWRLVAAAACTLVGVAAATALPMTSLSISVTLTAGVIPLLSFVLLQRFAAAKTRQDLPGGVPAENEGISGNTPGQPNNSPPVRRTEWPHRSPLTLLALAVAAGAHLVLITASASVTAPTGPLLSVESDWISRAGLTADQDFGFIQRYLALCAPVDRWYQSITSTDGI